MNSHLTELVKAANHNRALLKRSRPPAGHCFIYCLHSKKLNMSYVGKTKQSMYKRMMAHRNPNSTCAGTQLFAMGDPEWSILEIVPTERAGEREDWHIANTRPATNVNVRSRPLEGAELRERLRKKKSNELHECPVKRKLQNRVYWHAKNAEAVALGHKNHYQRLKAEAVQACRASVCF